RGPVRGGPADQARLHRGAKQSGRRAGPARPHRRGPRALPRGPEARSGRSPRPRQPGQSPAPAEPAGRGRRRIRRGGPAGPGISRGADQSRRRAPPGRPRRRRASAPRGGGAAGAGPAPGPSQAGRRPDGGRPRGRRHPALRGGAAGQSGRRPGPDQPRDRARRQRAAARGGGALPGRAAARSHPGRRPFRPGQCAGADGPLPRGGRGIRGRAQAQAGRSRSARQPGASPPAAGPRRAMKAAWQAALIALAVGFAFWPALRGGWIWDDSIAIAQNPVMRDPAGLAKIWSGEAGTDYFPLAATAEWIGWRFWGDRPAGDHAASLALHLISALLFWRLLVRLGTPLPWLGGLIFGVHPLTVESVAWVSELKNTLSLPLLLLALL